MYTVPLETLLTLTDFRSHEESIDDGILVEFHPGLGKAMFVSHQWISECHPDPHYQQLKVLQDALRNVLSGACRISTDPTVEAFYGRVRGFSAAELKREKIFVWYDYLSCPQLLHDIELDEFGIQRGRFLDDSMNCEEMDMAIKSIPSYVAACKYFIALCPTLINADNGRKLDRHSWLQRGWCRAEKITRELSAEGRNGLILLVESPRHLTLLPSWESFLYGPGYGEFTYITDLNLVAGMIKDLLMRKLQDLLSKGDLPAYRFYLNQQHVRFRKCRVEAIQGLVPGNDCADIAEKFFHENGCLSVDDRDRAGWSSMCYAAINGNPQLMTRLLELHGDPNDRTHQGKAEAFLPKHLPLVSLCTYFCNNEALKILLEAHANPNQRDARHGAPLFWANLCDNVTGARLLLDFRADPLMEGNPPLTVTEAACSVGAIRIIQEYLPVERIRSQSRNLLHIALMIKGGSPEFIDTLIKHGVDVNETFSLTKLNMLKKILVAKHYVCGPSTLSSVFYHAKGSTPLMLAILSGSFTAAELLLEAKATVDVRNSRNRTALDFAAEKQAPMSLLLALRAKRGVSEHWFLANAALWQGHADWDGSWPDTEVEETVSILNVEPQPAPKKLLQL